MVAGFCGASPSPAAVSPAFVSTMPSPLYGPALALRADQLLKLAQALNVSVDDLVGTNGKKKRGTGPAGKMRQLFEAASRLPRSQQQKITALLEAFIAHNRGA